MWITERQGGARAGFYLRLPKVGDGLLTSGVCLPLANPACPRMLSAAFELGYVLARKGRPPWGQVWKLFEDGRLAQRLEHSLHTRGVTGV